MSFKNQTELIGGVNKIIENLNTRLSKGNLNKLKKLEEMNFKFLDQTGGKIMKETLHMLHENYDNRNENKPNIIKKNYISSIKKQALKGGGVTKNGDFTAEMKAVLDMVGGADTHSDTDSEEKEDDLGELHNDMLEKGERARECAEIEKGSGYTKALQGFIDTVPDTASTKPVDISKFDKLLKFNNTFNKTEGTNIIISLIKACHTFSKQIKDCETKKKAHDDLVKKVKSVAKKQKKAAVDAHANAVNQLKDANESHEDAKATMLAAKETHEKLKSHVASLEAASAQQEEIDAANKSLEPSKEAAAAPVAHNQATESATAAAEDAVEKAKQSEQHSVDLHKEIKNGSNDAAIGSGIEKAKGAANIAENAMTKAATAKEAAAATAAKQKEAAAKQKAVITAVNTAANDSK